MDVTFNEVTGQVQQDDAEGDSKRQSKPDAPSPAEQERAEAMRAARAERIRGRLLAW